MASRHSLERSSLLVSIPVIVSFGISCFVTAFYGMERFSSYLLVIFLFSSASRIWAMFSSSRMKASISVSCRGVFPGGDVDVVLNVKNGKLLPVAWLDLYMPVPRSKALVPEDSRAVESWEKAELDSLGASVDIVGTKRLGRMLWYEESEYSIRLHAKCRGICLLDYWRLSTGDGFGLSESEIRLSKGTTIAVYPRMIDVSTAPFFKNLWNSSTGSKGVMEDMTVIRSTRDYRQGDGVKNINWRLLARALPLTVNIYEDIQPKSIHILFDGESYRGHGDEMERTLSVIASELVRLEDLDMRCLLSLPSGSGGDAVTVMYDLGEALFSLSSYDFMKEKYDFGEAQPVKQVSMFDLSSVAATVMVTGHFFYFTFDASKLEDNGVLELLDESKVTIVSSVNTPCRQECGHLYLDDLVKGGVK